MTCRLGWILIFLISTLPSIAWTDGTAQLGVTQHLDNGTEIFADIDNPATETICWTGSGFATVYDPDDSSLGTIVAGSCILPAPGKPGTYFIDVLADQNGGWDFSVCLGTTSCTTPIPGRIFSNRWYFNTGSSAESAASNGSFFALLPGGGNGADTVVELRLDGLAGFVYDVGVNQTGVDGINAGRSVPRSGNNFSPQFPLYLNPPDLASYNPIAPVASNFAYSGGPLGCNQLSPGLTTGTFEFTSNIEGTYHLVCDLSQDVIFDIADPEDLLLIGIADVGTNTAEWDGYDNQGDPVAPGTYDCRVSLNVGEFHYVGLDIETCYEGLRLFEVQGNLSRVSMDMFWNDTFVQSAVINMPDGNESPAISPIGGLDSGDPADGASPHSDTTPGNARAWGNFSGEYGKGNGAYLDTFAVTRTDTTAALAIIAVDSATDEDGEQVPDVIEDCTLGTDPLNPDSDGDGIDDYVESNGGFRIDTNHDGTIDALDDDSDGDGLGDSIEGNVDTDSDGTPDYRDTDSDDDGIGDSIEGNVDTDSDGTPDYRDTDSDDDLIDDEDEGNVDTDSDGLPDYRDRDSDNDGVIDTVDTNRTNPDICSDSDGDMCDDCAIGTDNFGPLADNDPDNDGIDTDGDGLCDYSDPDDDNDGVTDTADINPTNPDICGNSDGDTCDDCAIGTDNFGPLSDSRPLNDGIDTDGDGLCNASDHDDDNDGIADAVDPIPTNPDICGNSDGDTCDDCAIGTDNFGPLSDNRPLNDGIDTDGDGLCDAGDPDDDNDGVIDTEDTNRTNPNICRDSDGDTCDDCYYGTDGFGPLADYDPDNDGTDTDGDGLCDANDPDDDNDGIVDMEDINRTDPDICGDSDDDKCDDCAIGTDDFGPLSDSTPLNDGTDGDGDGLCDTGNQVTPPDKDNPVVPGDDLPEEESLKLTGGVGCSCATTGSTTENLSGSWLLLLLVGLAIRRLRGTRLK
ncbi:MAG: hypothetical protein GY762_22760 [Proteobacteria bacterium]|nr:hypothetical protein [Pseudomonadota bacterium]